MDIHTMTPISMLERMLEESKEHTGQVVVVIEGGEIISVTAPKKRFKYFDFGNKTYEETKEYFNRLAPERRFTYRQYALLRYLDTLKEPQTIPFIQKGLLEFSDGEFNVKRGFLHEALKRYLKLGIVIRYDASPTKRGFTGFKYSLATTR